MDAFDPKVLDDIFTAMPMVGRKCVEKQKTSIAIANQLLGIKLEIAADRFKERSDFASDDDYKGYMMVNLKKNMIVRCNQDIQSIKKGTLGIVAEITSIDGPVVKWPKYSQSNQVSFLQLDLVTSPCAHYI